MDQIFGRGSMGLLILVAVTGPVIVALGRRKAPLGRILLVIATAGFSALGALQIHSAVTKPLGLKNVAMSYALKADAEGRQSITIPALPAPFMSSVAVFLGRKDPYDDKQPNYSSQALRAADIRVAGSSPSWMDPGVTYDAPSLHLADIELKEPVEISYTVTKDLRPVLESSVVRVGISKYGASRLADLKYGEWGTGILSLVWAIVGLALQVGLLLKKDRQEDIAIRG